MKKLVLVILSVFLFSCSEDSIPSQKLQETYSISSTETLEILLATAIPIEGGYSISDQAENFRVSEVRYKEHGIFYVYVPKEGFNGTDVVRIKREDSNGATVYAETVTTYKINVKE